MNDFILRIMAWAKSLDRDHGASAVEYVLILAAIVGTIGVAVWAISTRSSVLISRACTGLGIGC